MGTRPSRLVQRLGLVLILMGLLAPGAHAQEVPDPTATEPPPAVSQQTECTEPVETCFPDLIPTNPSAQATHEREKVTACAEFVNIGRNPTSGSFRVLLKIDGAGVGEKQFTKVYQRGEGERDICWRDLTIARGRHTMTIVVDSNREVAESNERNNERTITFLVGAEPKVDLELTRFNVTPREGSPRGPQIFTIDVTNIGTNTSIPTVVNLSDTHGVMAFLPLPALAPGATHKLAHATRPDIRPVGTWIARAFVDEENKNEEIRESNNEAFLEYVVLEHPAPDFEIKDVKIHGELVALRGVRVDVHVVNVGDRPVRGNLIRVLDVDNNTLSEGYARNILYPGMSSVVQFIFTLPAGYHTMRLVADPYERVQEHNETNNVWLLELDVAEPTHLIEAPNLIVERLYAMPADPRPGEPMSVGALVKNIGVNASNATVVNFTANGRVIGQAPVPVLKPQQSHTAYVPWVARESEFALAAHVDPADRVQEIDEQDNRLVRDFIVTSAQLDPEPEAPPTTPTPPPPTPTPATPTPATPKPATPTPAAPAAPSGPKVAFADLSIETRPVPGGVKGTITASLRNPNIQRVGLLSTTFKVDGEKVTEKLLNGLAGAAQGPVTTGEIDLPAGRHTVTVEVRLVGSNEAPIVREQEYEATAGKKDGIPGAGSALGVAALAALAFLRRRKN